MLNTSIIYKSLTNIYRIAFIPFLRKEFLKHEKELRYNEKISYDELNELILIKLKYLVEHAYLNVPFYRNRYRSIGFEPGDLKELDDFRKLPILIREDIKLHYDEMVAENINKSRLVPVSTGGSSGTPIKVYHDRSSDNMMRAIESRVLRWWNVSRWDRAVRIYRIPDNIHNQEFTNFSWFSRFTSRSAILNASLMTPKNMLDFFKFLENFRPTYLYGYVGGIEAFANFILDNHLHRSTNLMLRAIGVTSSPVTALQRKIIEKAFRAPVYDQYGSCEIFWYASECKIRDGMHILSDIRYLEFLDGKLNPTSENITGKIVATDLLNYVFPLIRYANGDEGSYKSNRCSCGMSLPLMNNVKGRVSDTIKLKNGVIISGDYLTTIFDDFVDEVKQFQVVQKSIDHIEIFVVLSNRSAFEIIKAKVLRRLLYDVKGLVKVSFIEKEFIPHDRGKFKYIISELQGNK